MITHEEALEWHDKYMKVLNELEELKRGVKRYFEISGHTHGNNELIYEWYELHSKLLKVGKEE